MTNRTIQALVAMLLMAALSLLTAQEALAQKTGNVVVSIRPLHALVQGVMGDTGLAILLVEGGQSPHGYQLKPSQMQLLQTANAVFYIDDAFETFLPRVLETLPEKVQREAVAQKAGLTILDRRKTGAWESHAHEEHEEPEHHAAHEGKPHTHDQQDLHVWLSPDNAAKIISYIRRELTALYPEHASIYEVNEAVMLNRLAVLDTKLQKKLAPVKNKPFIVFHDAFQYFERHYELRGVGSITLEPEHPPSAARVREIRKRIRETGAICVFREPQFSGKLVDTVIEGTHTSSGTLDPMGVSFLDSPDSYFLLLEQLTDQFVQCLNTP